MTRQEYINHRINNNNRSIIIEYYIDLGIFKKDANIERIVEFLRIMDNMNLLNFNFNEVLRYFNQKFEIMHIIKDNIIIGIK